MSLSGIRTKINTALTGIGLNVSSYIPDTMTLPQAIISLNPENPVAYDYTARDVHYVFHFIIDVLVNKGASVKQAQIDLDPYLDPTHAYSIKNAIEAISWSTDASTSQLTGVPAYGGAVLTVGNVDFMGARFLLDVWV